MLRDTKLLPVSVYCIAVFGVLQTVKGQSSNGRSFAVAFPPSMYDDKSGLCLIIINAHQTTSIEIFFTGGFHSDTVYEGQPYQYAVSCERRTEGWIEDKVYYITSDYDISVLATNNNYDVDPGQMDSTIVFPYDKLHTEYYLLIYVNPDGDVGTDYSCGEYNNTASFYVVSAFEDGTQVNVYDRNNYELIESITLGQYECYTNITTVDDRLYDFSGFYITASAPVSVSAGSSCTYFVTDIDQDGLEDGGITWSYMPPVVALMPGNFFTNDIKAATDNPYAVMLLSIEEDTFTVVNGQSYYLNRGDKRTVLFANNSDLVYCSKPCLAMQLNNNYEDYTGIFILPLLPEAAFNEDVVFSAPPTFNTNWRANVVVTILSSDTGLIKTERLSTATWDCKSVSGIDACQLHTYISSQGTGTQARVYTTNAAVVKFSVVVYGQREAGEGYGYSAGYNVTTSNSTGSNYRSAH